MDLNGNTGSKFKKCVKYACMWSGDRAYEQDGGHWNNV